MKVEQKQALSRQEAARFIAELAEGLGDDGKVTLRLGSSTVELAVASSSTSSWRWRSTVTRSSWRWS